MEIEFTEQMLSALRKAGCKSVPLAEKDQYGRDKEIDSDHIVSEDYPIIKKVLKTGDLANLLESKRAFKKIEALESLNANATGGVIKDLELLPEAIRKRMGGLARKWCFKSDDFYSMMVPYFLEKAVYHEAVRRGGSYTPAHVIVNFEAMERGEDKSRSATIHKEDLKKSVDEILGNEGYFIETPKLVSDYEADMALYAKYAPLTGEQFLGKGKAAEIEEGSRWRRNEIQLEKDGSSSKLIMDDEEKRGEKEGTSATRFWLGKKKSLDEDADDGEVYPCPAHPVLRAFHLGIHEYVLVHVSFVEPYKYDPSLRDKLVLPKDQSELIDALTGNAIKKMSDIISGKAIGVIILSSGKPGTGKTLTAEVYSEVAQRPLYMVQCSQLGTDEEELEKYLGVVLQRATRWRAILLIDEADVYIHERGDDIQQNAIVGVFLRLLEYYNGILFLTTNRETIIDDAIISRVTAHVRYDVPKEESEKMRIWTILLTQYGVKELLDKKEIKKLVDKFPQISGRSIRQLVRLSKIMADQHGKKVSFEDVVWAAKFHDFTELEAEGK